MRQTPVLARFNEAIGGCWGRCSRRKPQWGIFFLFNLDFELFAGVCGGFGNPSHALGCSSSWLADCPAVLLLSRSAYGCPVAHDNMADRAAKYPAASNTPVRCAKCGSASASFKCGGCASAVPPTAYCNPACQKAAWSEHRPACKLYAALNGPLGFSRPTASPEEEAEAMAFRAERRRIHVPNAGPLVERLLAIGGKDVVFSSDDNWGGDRVPLLLEHGSVFSGVPVEIYSDEDGEGLLSVLGGRIAKGEDARFCIGFFLYPDGLWRGEKNFGYVLGGSMLVMEVSSKPIRVFGFPASADITRLLASEEFRAPPVEAEDERGPAPETEGGSGGHSHGGHSHRGGAGGCSCGHASSGRDMAFALPDVVAIMSPSEKCRCVTGIGSGVVVLKRVHLGAVLHAGPRLYPSVRRAARRARGGSYLSGRRVAGGGQGGRQADAAVVQDLHHLALDAGDDDPRCVGRHPG